MSVESLKRLANRRGYALKKTNEDFALLREAAKEAAAFIEARSWPVSDAAAEASQVVAKLKEAIEKQGKPGHG